MQVYVSEKKRYVKIIAALGSLAPAIPVTGLLGYFFERCKQRLSKMTIFGLPPIPEKFSLK